MCEFTGWKERGKEEGSYLLRGAHEKEKKKKVVKGSAVKVYMDSFWSIQTMYKLDNEFLYYQPPPKKIINLGLAACLLIRVFFS